MRQLLVASEYGEPSNFSSEICTRLNSKVELSGKEFCLLIISKKPYECLSIIDIANILGFPIQLHCTITGLGGTKFEPHIPPYKKVLEESIETIKWGFVNPEAVTVRIDPLIPELFSEQMKAIPNILEGFAEVGVRDCRISVIDYYPHVRQRFNALGIKVCSGFQPTQLEKELIINKVAYLTVQLGMRLHLCAETLPGLTEDLVDTEGCASSKSWARLGITDLKSIVKKQRKECTCDLSKEDLLKGLDKGCNPGCAYCYWR